jgi:hypothetical protein
MDRSTSTDNVISNMVSQDDEAGMSADKITSDPSWLSEILKKPHAPIAEIVIAGHTRDKVRSELGTLA